MTQESDFDTEFKKGMQTPCPQCKEPMHMAAKRCPNCQYDFSDNQVRNNIASKKFNRSGCLITLGVIGVISLVGIAMPTNKEEIDNNPILETSKELSSEDIFGYQEAAKLIVSERLRDPDSAIFSDITVYPEQEDRPVIICGYVNSRNGFGGMTGPQRFIAGGTVMLEEQFTKKQMSIGWNRFCN